MNSAPRASRGDSIRFTAAQMLPLLLRGLFKRRPRVSAMLDWLQSDPQGVARVGALQRRYGSDFIWLTLSGKPTLLVLDTEGIRQVLDASPDTFGPPELKVKGMSHFQPDALTLSTGEDWTRRRALSDQVLGAGSYVHPQAAEFARIIESVVSPICSGDTMQFAWPDMQRAFREITGRVVLGASVERESVLAQLDALMKRANGLSGDPDTPERAALHAAIRERVGDAKAGGLAARACPYMTAGDPLPVAGQMTHWLFAMKDTLAANTMNALALIAAHPNVAARASAEAATFDASDPSSVSRMMFIEGALRDTMRLFPTTPLLTRRARKDAEVCGHPVLAGSQVLIHNGFNHRNPRWLDAPDRFRPENAKQGEWDYRFNYMSNGPQACGGRELALFLGTAVLAQLLRRHDWTLMRPSIDPARPIRYAMNSASVVLSARARPRQAAT